MDPECQARCTILTFISGPPWPGACLRVLSKVQGHGQGSRGLPELPRGPQAEVPFPLVTLPLWLLDHFPTTSPVGELTYDLDEQWTSDDFMNSWVSHLP